MTTNKHWYFPSISLFLFLSLSPPFPSSSPSPTTVLVKSYVNLASESLSPLAYTLSNPKINHPSKSYITIYIHNHLGIEFALVVVADYFFLCSRSLYFKKNIKKQKNLHTQPPWNWNNEAFEVYNHDLECPVQAFGNNYFRIAGSCKGLVCLSDDLFDIFESICLWNPSIRKAIAILKPRFCTQNVASAVMFLGLVMMPCGINFKVVRNVHSILSDHDSVIPKVVIYTLGTQSWRDISSSSLSHYYAISKVR